MAEWAHDEDLYELSYSELSVGAHWPPFAELANIPAPFEERVYSSAPYHELLGQHTTFAEHAAISAPPCPYIAYLGPFPPPSSYISGRFADNTNSSHWNGRSLLREVHEYIPFHAMDLHQHLWEDAAPPPSMSSSHTGTADVAPVASFTQRSGRINSDISRSGSTEHPYHMDSERKQSGGQRSVSRSGMIAYSHGLGGGFFFSPVGSPGEHLGWSVSLLGEDRLTSLLSQADQDMSWEPSQSANLVLESGARWSSYGSICEYRSLSRGGEAGIIP